MSDPPLPSEIVGRYRLLRLIGRGGMGRVYEAEHLFTQRHLALKVLTPQLGTLVERFSREAVERFSREARAARHIHSEHIVYICDAGTAPELNGAPFLVMELLEGANLEEATRDHAAAPADVVEWLRQVARGLAKAHGAGIVHRDLKPENLFLTRHDDGSPLVKILDFGLVKDAAEATALTASDALLGTPSYMAPEQTDRERTPTPQTDLYALGLIAFKLLTGRKYWRNGSLAQLYAQILAEPMPPASERGSTMGPCFDAWFARACDRDANKRFDSAREQIEALAAALGAATQSTQTTEPLGSVPAVSLQPDGAGDRQSLASLNAPLTDLTTGRRRKPTHSWMLGAGVVAATIGVVVGAALMRSAGPAPARVGRASVSVAPISPPAPQTVPSPTATATAASDRTANAPASASASTSSSSSAAPVPAPIPHKLSLPAASARTAPVPTSVAPRGGASVQYDPLAEPL